MVVRQAVAFVGSSTRCGPLPACSSLANVRMRFFCASWRPFAHSFGSFRSFVCPSRRTPSFPRSTCRSRSSPTVGGCTTVFAHVTAARHAHNTAARAAMPSCFGLVSHVADRFPRDSLKPKDRSRTVQGPWISRWKTAKGPHRSGRDRPRPRSTGSLLDGMGARLFALLKRKAFRFRSAWTPGSNPTETNEKGTGPGCS